ncbi:MAG: endonuclease domain-containing protein [Chitinophagaceae bacterium]|nr:MAG: endonuclease domain-containing protein [Chitinophagaceae bacterium]
MHRTGFARENRRDMTEAEKRLWQRIRKDQIKGCRFRRQHIIGKYIVDFVSLSQKLVIEVDGGYHRSASQQAADAERDQELRSKGFRILRFTNEQVMKEINSVVAAIAAAIE